MVLKESHFLSHLRLWQKTKRMTMAASMRLVFSRLRLNILSWLLPTRRQHEEAELSLTFSCPRETSRAENWSGSRSPADSVVSVWTSKPPEWSTPGQSFTERYHHWLVGTERIYSIAPVVDPFRAVKPPLCLKDTVEENKCPQQRFLSALSCVFMA